MEAHAEGTVIRCTFGMHPFVIVFMAIWFTGVIVGCGVFTVAAFQGAVGGGQPAFGVAVPYIMLAFGLGLVWFGRYLARGEEQFLVSFLATAIDAQRN